MTNDEVKAAIERLCLIEPSDYVGSEASVAKVVWGFMDGAVSGEELRDVLVNLLRQADPDTHIALPVDAEGGVIRIGDKVEHCYNGRWGEPFEIVELWLRPSGWMVRGEKGAAVIAETCRRYNKPTVEDVLTELVDVAIGDIADKARNENMTYNDWVKSNEVIAGYAEKLREVMADDL